MATKRSTPRVAHSDIVRYLSQIFKVRPVLGCRTAEDAIKLLGSLDEINIPVGLDEECCVILERYNIRGELWNLTPRKQIVQNALELVGDEQSAFFLMCDEHLSGVESLFLCAVTVNNDQQELRTDLAYLCDEWAKYGAPCIGIGGYVDKKYGGTVHIVAAQLITLI